MESKTVDFTIKNISKENARTLALWIEMSLFDTIRNDDEVDNINWVKFWVNVIDELESIDWSGDESENINWSEVE